jgi:hypothetical protein
VRYQAAFVASRQWQTIRFRPEDFRASRRGRTVAARPLEFERAQTVGLLISDSQSGPFRIELKEVGVDATERTAGARANVARPCETRRTSHVTELFHRESDPDEQHDENEDSEPQQIGRHHDLLARSAATLK